LTPLTFRHAFRESLEIARLLQIQHFRKTDLHQYFESQTQIDVSSLPSGMYLLKTEVGQYTFLKQ
jgi:hypothetical protein